MWGGSESGLSPLADIRGLPKTARVCRTFKLCELRRKRKRSWRAANWRFVCCGTCILREISSNMANMFFMPLAAETFEPFNTFFAIYAVRAVCSAREAALFLAALFVIFPLIILSGCMIYAACKPDKKINRPKLRKQDRKSWLEPEIRWPRCLKKRYLLF